MDAAATVSLVDSPDPVRGGPEHPMTESVTMIRAILFISFLLILKSEFIEPALNFRG